MHNIHNVCMMEKITHIADSFLLGGLEPQPVQMGANVIKCDTRQKAMHFMKPADTLSSINTLRQNCH